MYTDRPPTRKAAPLISFWSLIHLDIVAIARPRYESGHYADSVEAALKEIHSRLNIAVKQNTGHEYDDADLMTHVFSLGNQILVLDGLETDDGRNIQRGYVQIFAGAMTGIRNPKAHSNIVLSAEEAIDLLFLACLMMKRFETAAKKANAELQGSTQESAYIFGWWILVLQ